MSDLYREAAAAAERAEERAERLQLKLDEQVALNGQLRRQLRESSSSAQQVASQLRLLQGAPGSSDATCISVAGLQRTVTVLRDRVDVEKKAANAAQAECANLEKRLSSGARERQALLASQQELRSELQRRTTELERLTSIMRESGQVREEAAGQVTNLNVTRTREQQRYEKEIAELKAALEVERKRAANRAARTAAAEAALRRTRGETVAGGGDKGGGYLGSSWLPGSFTETASSSSASGEPPSRPDQLEPLVPPADDPYGRRCMDFDVPWEPPAVRVAPSSSVSAMASEAERERMARLEAEEAALRAAAEHAHEREVLLERAQAAEASAASLGAQLERHGLVAQLAAGGSGARSTLRALERQLDEQRRRADAAEAGRLAAISQTRQMLAAVCTLAELPPPTLGPRQQATVRLRETIRELRRASGEAAGDGAGDGAGEGAGEGGLPPTIGDGDSERDDETASDSAAHPPSPPGASLGAADAAGSSAELSREIARCLELLGRRLRSVASPAEKPTGALAEMNGAAAQSPDSTRRSGHGKGCGGRGARRQAPQWLATPSDGRERACVVLHEYEAKVAKASAAHDGRARFSAAFDATLAQRRGEKPPSELRLATEAAAAEHRRGAREASERRLQRRAALEAQQQAVAEAEAAEEASRLPRALEVATRALRLATPGLEAVAALEVLREAQAGPRLSAAQLEEVVAAAKQELQIAALAAPTAAPASAPAPPAAQAGSASPVSTAESPPSPPPLTRDQIKAQYLDRLTANERHEAMDNTRTGILVLNSAQDRDAPTAGRITLGRGARGIGRGGGLSLMM
jgi:hypothetical protein